MSGAFISNRGATGSALLYLIDQFCSKEELIEQ